MRIVAIIITIIFFLFSITEVYNLFFGDLSWYAFGSNLSSSYSIYISYKTYLVYNLISLVFSVLTIIFYKKKIFYWFFIVSLILNLYPIVN